MIFEPIFPTQLHAETALLVRNYFLSISNVDTVLVVNSCARGQAVAESDLDFAILISPGTTVTQTKNIETSWKNYSVNHPQLLKYTKSNPYAHLHLDLLDGNYYPGNIEAGEPINFFEIEIGNHICYSAPMGEPGVYFRELQKKWLPYYNDELRRDRLRMIKSACTYDLGHIPFFVKRELYFQAFDLLCKAFQEYLQTLFISKSVYPIVYNKWIREQVVNWLGMPELYPKLSPVLSVSNIESNEINEKAAMLGYLLNDILIE